MRPSTTSKYAAVVAVASLASSARAQLDSSLITGLSSSCGNSLLGLLSNSDLTSCLSLSTAVNAISSAGNSSLVPALNTYFDTSICPNAPCTSSALTSANQSLSTGCASDLEQGASVPSIIVFLLTNYDAVRDAGCLREKSNNQLCLTQTLYALQNSTDQPLSFSTLSGLLSGDQQSTTTLTQFAQNRTLLCTDCNDALLTTVQHARANSTSSSTSSALAPIASAASQQCGSAFTDGVVPQSVEQSARGNSTSSAEPTGGSRGAEKNAAQHGVRPAMVASVAFGLVAAGVAALF